MPPPIVSIIVPVYNVEEYVVKCLNSILAQTYENFECIIIDDGSTDSSLNICRMFESKDPRIKVFEKKNGGLGSARNMGIEKSIGKYISFIDSDDWVSHVMMETMVRTACVYNASIVVCGHVVQDSGQNEIINGDGSVHVYNREDALNRIMEDKEIFSFAWDKLYVRELFKEITYPIGRVFEDTATTYKLFAKTDTVVKINLPLYNYVRRQGSLSLRQNPILNYHNFLAFFERYTFAKKSNLKVKPVCLDYAMRQAAGLIDNYSLLSQVKRRDIPIKDVNERIHLLRKEFIFSKINIPYFKLFIFCLSAPLYFFSYRIFSGIKRSL